MYNLSKRSEGFWVCAHYVYLSQPRRSLNPGVWNSRCCAVEGAILDGLAEMLALLRQSISVLILTVPSVRVLDLSPTDIQLLSWRPSRPNCRKDVELEAGNFLHRALSLPQTCWLSRYMRQIDRQVTTTMHC